ncbi:hypothetical protein M1146_05375, partial [Patescibacteria group bacterium]|nr:hypothetical protein [Patescibacteria group bacterium]
MRDKEHVEREKVNFSERGESRRGPTQRDKSIIENSFLANFEPPKSRDRPIPKERENSFISVARPTSNRETRSELMPRELLSPRERQFSHESRPTYLEARERTIERKDPRDERKMPNELLSPRSDDTYQRRPLAHSHDTSTPSRDRLISSEKDIRPSLNREKSTPFPSSMSKERDKFYMQDSSTAKNQTRRDSPVQRQDTNPASIDKLMSAWPTLKRDDTTRLNSSLGDFRPPNLNRREYTREDSDYDDRRDERRNYAREDTGYDDRRDERRNYAREDSRYDDRRNTYAREDTGYDDQRDERRNYAREDTGYDDQRDQRRNYAREETTQYSRHNTVFFDQEDENTNFFDKTLHPKENSNAGEKEVLQLLNYVFMDNNNVTDYDDEETKINYFGEEYEIKSEKNSNSPSLYSNNDFNESSNNNSPIKNAKTLPREPTNEKYNNKYNPTTKLNTTSNKTPNNVQLKGHAYVNDEGKLVGLPIEWTRKLAATGYQKPEQAIGTVPTKGILDYKCSTYISTKP